MEQKKVLWTLFFVAALLLVVVGAGLIWFLPEDGGKSVAYEAEEGSRESAAGFDPIEWVRSEEDIPGMETVPVDNEKDFVVAENIVIGTDEEASEGEPPEEMISQEETDRQIRLIDPAPGSRPLVQRTEPRRVEPDSTPVVTREPEKRLVTEYWIQAGSYAGNSRANLAKEKLEEKGLPCTIQTRELENGTFFRVRIGPCSDIEEAAKFLDWVKNLDGFQDSYITEVYIRK